TVDAVAVQPRGQHVPLALHRVQHVDAGGLQVGALAVAPHVVGAGEGGAVLPAAADARPGGVGHRERRAGAGRADLDGAAVEAVAGAVLNPVVAVDHVTGVGVDVVHRRRRVAVRRGTG